MTGERTYVCKLSAASIKKAKDELNEDPQERMSQIEALRTWVTSQPHLKCRTDDDFLLRFLRCAKFSQLRAQEKLDNFLTVRCSTTKGIPDWFTGLDPLDPKLSKIIDMGISVPLPGRDDNGRKVVLVRTGAYDPSEIYYGDIMRIGFMNSDIMLLDEELQVNGLCVILDFGLFTTSHMTVFNRELLSKCMKGWQDVYPTRNKGINYFNTSSIFNAFFELSKLFMKEKTKKRMVFHKGSLESLQNSVPKRMLPTEYGGDAGPLLDLAKSWKEHLIKNRNELEQNQSAFAVDESKRPVKPEEQSGGWGLVGSFRKLAT